MPVEQDGLQKQANSRHCFVCGVENDHGLGLRFFLNSAGEVIAHYTVPEHFQGYPGLAHGGIVAAMLDEITGRAYMGGDPNAPRFMFTAKLEIRYRKNVPVGQPLRLVGRQGRSKSHSAVARGELYGPDGDLLAEADALLVDVGPEVLHKDDLAALGWKVYEE
jgi:acyl-coenzyme A thioesterase PaaI-like protein